ncbi:MAG TPA: replication initiator, partial [Rugosimonospora sp.]|nr:replication initiator [Rugosimonospora sp.]
SVDTASMPDGLIYKACGNRRASVCPACARTYQRDAFQLLRAGLVGGKGVPATVATHPAVFATFTAPSFGHVHTRAVRQHTCANRKRCDCRPDPCRARTGRHETGLCQHDRPSVCFARHEPGDPRLGQPLCVDCYDHDHQAVWNLYSAELWRRTKQAVERHLHKCAKRRGIPDAFVLTPTGVAAVPPVRLSHGKAAEMQRRGAVHFHALIRLDGLDPADPDRIVPPPAGLTAVDLDDAVTYAARHVTFTTPDHPDRPGGWPMTWGKQLDIRHITLTGADRLTDESVTDSMVAGYLAKYATKSTEATGYQSTRLTAETIDAYADPDGDHIARLIDACWRLGRPLHTPVPLTQRPTPARPARQFGPRWTCPTCGTPTRLAECVTCQPSSQADLDTKPATSPTPTVLANPYARLRRWAHMLGFGGHFLTKARRYSITFGLLRAARIDFRRAEDTDPGTVRAADHTDEETTLVIGALTFAGAGWHNTGDAVLANTSAAMARARAQAARDELDHETGSSLHPMPVAA